jgi:hypothetical protein
MNGSIAKSSRFLKSEEFHRHAQDWLRELKRQVQELNKFHLTPVRDVQEGQSVRVGRRVGKVVEKWRDGQGLIFKIQANGGGRPFLYQTNQYEEMWCRRNKGEGS